MIDYDVTPVAMRGEPLSEIFWQGRQWAVTSYGVECRDGCYFIKRNRLHESREVSGRDLPEWPLHLAEKEWVDIDDFCTAFLIALGLLGEGIFETGQLQDGIRRAQKEHARAVAFAKKLADSGKTSWTMKEFMEIEIDD